MFTLTKWYFDLTTPNGDVAIAYCAEVRWGLIRQPLSGIFVAPASGSPESWRFSSREVAEPVLDDASLRWSSEPLLVSIEYARSVTGFYHRLFDSPSGHIDWRCDVPRGDARLRIGDRELAGDGYAERLELTLLPWKIPADEIRWGRFIAAGVSVVWIDWRGEHSQSIVFVDGRIAPSVAVSESAIRFADGRELRLSLERVLSDDLLGDVLSPLESIRSLVEPIMRTRQTRWLSRGVLCDGASGTASGWAVHEIVRRR